ncbi:MAG: DNA glycosylase AlkZ-like family protein [Thermoplasmata archaeon]
MKISAEKARRVLSHVHGFDSLGKGKEDTAELFDKIPCIQVDPINSAGRNHDLTLFSRIEDYSPEYLSELLYEDNQLFEYYCKMLSILPIDYFPYFKFEMDRLAVKNRVFLKQYQDEIAFILKKMNEEPLSSLELEDMGDVVKGSWRSRKLSHKLLRTLWLTGRTVVHHREGRRMYYTPVENIVPEHLRDKNGIGEKSYRKKITEIIVKSSKLVSPRKASAQWKNVGGVRDVRAILEELEQEGKVLSLEMDEWNGKLYSPIEDKDIWENAPSRGSSYARFLAPLDPLLWNRELFASIFDHEYVWEVYKPKEERKYGHYCLPILYNDEYVGLFEPYLDGKVLEIRNFHLFNKVNKNGFLTEFEREIERYMEFLGAESLKTKSDYKFIDDMN